MLKKLILILLLILLPSVSYGLPAKPCEGLTFTAPILNTDGAPVDLAGYYVYWSVTSGGYSDADRYQFASAPVLFTDMVGLANPVDMYFVVTAYNSAGDESAFSNEYFNTPLVTPTVPGGLGCSG